MQFRDKIVQLAVHNIIEKIYEPIYISNSYACRKNKGTHRAVYKVQENMRRYMYNYGKESYIVKLDVRKFFYNIDRTILKKLLKKQIQDGKLLELLCLIIDSSPEGAKGIPLGNVTSQDFANIYMNELDQYVTRYLGVDSYVRYADDVICICKTKEAAQELKNNMIKFLSRRLKLKVNSKTTIFPIHQGVNAYGYKIYYDHKLVRDDSKKKMKRKMKKLHKEYMLGIIKLEDLLQSVNSWLGHARHSNSYNLCKKIFSKYDYIKIEGDEKFGRISRIG